VTFSDRFSAAAKSGFQSLFLTMVVNCSVCAGSFCSVSLKRFSASSSESISSSASSGHASMHFGSPWQRSHAMAFPVSVWMVIPPYSQACTHQSQPLHFFSSMISMPVFSDCERAFSGQAFTHLASSHARQVNAKLKSGVMRTTRILERIGFQMASPFSSVHAYSQIPHPVHLLGSTDTNFLCWVLADCILVTKPLWYLDICVRNWLLTVT
jgi:hypothetical protein